MDVLLDPLQREQLVVEALVRLQVGAHHEAQRAEAVVHGDENDVALRRQVLALHHPGAALKGAAVDEDHHRAFRRALLCWHPHVQVEAVCTNKKEIGLRSKVLCVWKNSSYHRSVRWFAATVWQSDQTGGRHP